MPGPEPGADFGPQAAGAAKKPGLGDVLRQGYNYAKGELGRIGQKSGVGASELAAHSPEPLAPAQPAAEAEWDPFADDPNAPPRPETPDQAREARISSVLAEIVDAPRQQAAAAEIPDDELPDWLSSSEIGQGSEPSASPVVAGPTRPAPDEVAFGVGMINRHNVRRADNPAGPGAAVPAASLSESPAAAGAGDDAEPAIKAYNTEDLDIPAFLRRRNAAAAPAVASETAVDASSPQTRRADDFAEHATKGGPAALVQGQGAKPDWLSGSTPVGVEPPAPAGPAQPASPAETTFADLGLDPDLFTPAPALAAAQPLAGSAAGPSSPAPAEPTLEDLGLDPDLFTPPATILTAAPSPGPQPSPEPVSTHAAEPTLEDLGLDPDLFTTPATASPPAAAPTLTAEDRYALQLQRESNNLPVFDGAEEWLAKARAAKETTLAPALTVEPLAPAPDAAPRATYESLVTQYGLTPRSAETVRKIIETGDPADRNGVEKTVSAIVEALGVSPDGKTPPIVAQELYDSIKQQPQVKAPEKPQAPKEKKPKKYRKGTLPFSDQLADLGFTTEDLADIRAQLKFASGATLRPEGDKGALKSEEDVRELQLQFIQARLATKFHVDLSENQKGASVKGFDLKEVAQAVYDSFKREEAQYLKDNPQVAWLYGKIKDLKAANEANPRLEASLVAVKRAQYYSEAEQFQEARAVLQKMEDRGTLKGGTVKEVEKADLDFRGISSTYHGIEVRDAGVKYLEYIAQIMTGSSGDWNIPPQIVDSIRAHQRSEAFRQFREIATHPRKGSMITLSADDRYYIFAKDGRPVTLDTINAVIGMNERGVVESPQAIVSDAAEVILDEVAKVTWLNSSIRQGEEAVGMAQTAHEKRIDAIRTCKIEGVREVCEFALSETGSQVSLLQREIDAKQKEIEAIKASPEASDQVTEPVRKSRQVRMSQLDAQLATLIVKLKKEQAGLDALKEQTERIIQGTVEGGVEPEMDAMRASADEDVYVLKAQLLRQGPERIQLYHDQVLATALQEGTTAMGELSKWQSLLTRQGREEVVDKVAQTLLQNQSQLDSFQARRSILQGLAGKKKGELPLEFASVKPAERTKKINEEIKRLTVEIDRLDGERRDNYTRSYNELIPTVEVFNTKPQSKVGEIYQFAVLGGEAMVPTGDGTTRERVVKPGLKQLARYGELQGEIDARVKELREEAGIQPVVEVSAQAPISSNPQPGISHVPGVVVPQPVTAVPGLENASGV